jgi:hypothetical protein
LCALFIASWVLGVLNNYFIFSKSNLAIKIIIYEIYAINIGKKKFSKFSGLQTFNNINEIFFTTFPTASFCKKLGEK